MKKTINFSRYIIPLVLPILSLKGVICMPENGGRKKTAAKVDWVLAGNKTVIPENAKPSKTDVNIAIRRNKHPSKGNVPHPSIEDVMDAKEFVDSNQKQ